MIKLSITMNKMNQQTAALLSKLTTGFLSCVHNKCPILVNLNQTVKGSMRSFWPFLFYRSDVIL